MTGVSRPIDYRAECPTLFKRDWPAGGLKEVIALVDPTALCSEYKRLQRLAPRRSSVGKRYFVGHSGFAPAGASNRQEERCAIALVNLGRRWPRANGGWFRLLDYQAPLKARRADPAIGKIDLLGVTDQGRLMLVELKVEGKGGARSDSPPAALMEGLRYAAMVEADFEAIAREVEQRFGTKVARIPPIVLVLAPTRWWEQWFGFAAAGDWGPVFSQLMESTAAQTSLAIECMALEGVEMASTAETHAPRLERIPILRPVLFGQDESFGMPLSPPASASASTTSYEEIVRGGLWDWADRHHSAQLDGGKRKGRPPVLKREFAAMNVIVPPDGNHAEEIRALIGSHQRHRHFGSLRSSQALAQSVFAALRVFNRLDVLADIPAECGRKAFYESANAWSLDLEYDVTTLGEPRSTSIDVLLRGSGRQVAVECKFTEEEFGTCSRPRLKESDPTYEAQRCDGSYRAQAGRTERCALTSIGVRYWALLPRLFAWPTDHDHAPCPLGPVYQLARNALAAVVAEGGDIDPTRGHALILYDARNPAFHPGGTADQQWEAATAACLQPGLLRRVSWQRLLGCIASATDLAWLTDALRDKYGLVPEPLT